MALQAKSARANQICEWFFPLAALHQEPKPPISGVKQKACAIPVQRAAALITILNRHDSDSGKTRIVRGVVSRDGEKTSA
jgi:hypothetical protein